MAKDEKLVKKVKELETVVSDQKTEIGNLKNENVRLTKVEESHVKLTEDLTRSKDESVSLKVTVGELELKNKELSSGADKKESDSKISSLENEINGLKKKLSKYDGPFPRLPNGATPVTSVVTGEDGDRVDLHLVPGKAGHLILQTKIEKGKCVFAEFMR